MLAYLVLVLVSASTSWAITRLYYFSKMSRIDAHVLDDISPTVSQEMWHKLEARLIRAEQRMAELDAEQDESMRRSLRRVSAQLSRRLDSIQGTTDNRLSMLQGEIRSYQKSDGHQIHELSASVAQLVAAMQVLGGQVETVDKEAKRRLSSLSEARRADSRTLRALTYKSESASYTAAALTALSEENQNPEFLALES